ncbi:uncharacterized protein CDAR_180881 [Caerostris darwini]|uniref:Uncharacterized protein n=1 Tax=Caerostris darwini TaxID=1538125 RepID=A0AAV4VLQ8_9ARAC|nr:uncharacterized protein CDAR_180881 [Caerostris darwini]
MNSLYPKQVLFVIANLVLLLKFSRSNGDDPSQLDLDSFYKKEVGDFENWFQEKIENHEIEVPKDLNNDQRSIWHDQLHRQIFKDLTSSNHDVNSEFETPPEAQSQSSEEEYDVASNEQNGNSNLPLEENNPDSQVDKHIENRKVYYHQENNDANIANEEDESSLHATDEIQKEHHPAEVVFVRNDFDSASSLVEFVNGLLSPKKSQKTMNFDDPLFPDTCSMEKHPFYDKQMCPSSPQYAIEQHFSASYSENLRTQMAEKYSQRTDHEYRKRMKLKRDISERAICPFRWVESKRNPSRVPEYLFEAECTTDFSRGKSYLSPCVQLKSKIRVLWRVGCEDSYHVYSEGWEEISVACVPMGLRMVKSKQLDVVKVTPPE